MPDRHNIEELANNTDYCTRRCVMASVLVVVAFALLCFVITLFGWGWNQALVPENAARELREGMTLREAEYAMGLAPHSLDYHISTFENEKDVDVSGVGWAGSWFVPQHNIVLVFSPKDELVSCGYTMIWRIDEEYVPCVIGPSRH